MNQLNANRININSPYNVWTDGNILHFNTDFGIRYAVDFDHDDNPYFNSYWLNLTNENNKPSPNDKKISQTIICIIEEFFHANPDILLYMCRTDNGQQAQRSRLFLRWFNGSEQKKKYVIRTSEVRGEECDEYIALIIQRTHPQLEEVISIYDREIAMFQEHKPL